MTRYFALFLFLLTAFGVAAQSVHNPKLKQELDSIYVVDQRYRGLMSHTFTRRGTDSVATVLGMTPAQTVTYLIRMMPETDSSNTRRIGQIINQVGYPGESLVGTPTNEVAYYVIQHSTRINQYLPAVRRAAKRGELPYRCYAQMLDRKLVEDGKEQLYGTQIEGFTLPHQTGPTLIVWPIRHPALVNRRRRKAGFTKTVEENTKEFGIIYQVLTLENVRKMKQP